MQSTPYRLNAKGLVCEQDYCPAVFITTEAAAGVAGVFFPKRGYSIGRYYIRGEMQGYRLRIQSKEN